MKNTLVLCLFLPLFFSSTLASFIVDPVTSTASTCKPVLLQWQGGVAPWTLSIVDDDGNLIENLGTLKTTSFHWTVDVQAGTVVAARLVDSKGASATGKPFTVQSGSTDCTLRNGNSFIASTPPPPPQSTTSTSETSTSTSSSDTTTTESQPLQTNTSPSVSLNGIATSASASSQIPSQSISQSSTDSGTVTQSAVASPTQPPGSYYSPSATAALTKSNTHHTALAFAIVLPCLALLAIACLWFICRRRRRRASDLEARPLPRRWFDKPMYHSGVTVSTDLSTEPDAHAVGAVVASRPTLPLLNTAPATRTGGITAASPPTGRPIPTPTTAFPGTARTPRTAFPESALTPATQLQSALTPATQPPSAMPYSQLDDSSKDVEVLRYRIQTLLAENAVLADLVAPQADVPPPAYGTGEA